MAAAFLLQSATALGTDLFNNQLTGTIPTELGQLTSLTQLYLSSNQLTGSIPTELGRLTSLNTLSLSSNQLTGSIPTELGRLTSLKTLRLASNRLSGSIPCEFSNLKALSTSDFTNPLESTEFNATELASSCKTTIPSNSNPSITSSDLPSQQNSSASIIGGAVGAAVLSVLIIAVGFWCRQKRAKSKSQSDIATDERQSTVESMEQFPPSSSPPPSNAILNHDKNVPDSTPVDGFLVASNYKLVPEKSQLFGDLGRLSPQGPSEKNAANFSMLNSFPLPSNYKPAPEEVPVLDHLEEFPHATPDDRKFETVSSLKAAIPEGSTLAVSPGSI
ncbi:hypothetical protein BJ741DRAFT_86809 [Chytriomyces cf. hyalinus JEL632]|nr:hypothetical protein BJ741DRAFT_86809 [Chytriomyces cf. hyalinus JEL632]